MWSKTGEMWVHPQKIKKHRILQKDENSAAEMNQTKLGRYASQWVVIYRQSDFPPSVSYI